MPAAHYSHNIFKIVEVFLKEFHIRYWIDVKPRLSGAMQNIYIGKIHFKSHYFDQFNKSRKF